MTGKDLIIYILQNNLEDEEIFKDGRIAGFVTLKEAAVRLKVGVETIKVAIELKLLEGAIKIGDEYLISEKAIKNVILRKES